MVMKLFELISTALTATVMLAAITADISSSATAHFALGLVIVALAWFGGTLVAWISSIRKSAS